MRVTPLIHLIPLLSFVSDALAAPAPELLEARAPALAGSSGCDFDDDACECDPPGPTGKRNYYCGFVDQGWRVASAKRSVRPSTLDPLDTRQSADEDLLSTDTDLTRRDLPPPAVIRTKDPLNAALVALNAHYAFEEIEAEIRSRIPALTRNRYLQGLKGLFEKPMTIAGKKFAVDASWVIRWDFAQIAAPTALVVNRPYGPHVEILVQDKLAGQNRVHLAFYPLLDDPMVTAPEPGKYYFQHVLDPMAATARYNPYQDAFFELYGGGKLAREWLDKAGLLGKDGTKLNTTAADLYEAWIFK